MVDQAEIHRMARSKDAEERKRAVEKLKINFAILIDKEQAWDDLHRLTQDKNGDVRMHAAVTLGVCYSYSPDESKKQAWDDLHRLIQDNYDNVRRIAAVALSVCCSHIPDEYRKQAWDNLIGLTHDKDKQVRSHAAVALDVCCSHIPEEYRKQAWDDLIGLTRDNNYHVRKGANHALRDCYSHIPNEYKKQAWDDLQRLVQDNNDDVRWGTAIFLGVCYSQIPEEYRIQAWDDLIGLMQDNNNNVRRGAVFALGVCYSQIPVEYKKQAWDDLHRLTQDNNRNVRMQATDTLGVCYSYIPEECKKQAWDDLHRLTQDNNRNVQRGAAIALGVCYSCIPEEYKKQAWDDLHRLTKDNNRNVRMHATYTLGVCYSYIPEEYKKQAWDDLHRLTQSNVRMYAARALGVCYPQIPEGYRKQAWDDLRRLMQDNNDDVRWGAADTLGVCYSNIPEEYRKQTWDDLIGFTQDKNKDVRLRAARALGVCYSNIPEEYKKQAWDDLHRLTQDKDKDIRVAANHSSGRVSIYRASLATCDESVREELETALIFFEKSSKESTHFNPAKFCLPFYRSFHTITFRDEDAEAEMKKYLGEAKSALEGSKSKEKLLEAVENLGNALKEAQKTRDFSDVKADLNAYRQYCDRACELLDTTEEIAPGASRLIRKGLPIIDERIKGIIAEIQEKAKALCGETKNTTFRDAGLEINRISQDLSQIRDPIGLEKSVYNMQTVLSAICAKMAEEERGEACTLLRQAKEEQYIEDKINLINIVLGKISSQISAGKSMGNIKVENSNNVQVIVGTGNKQVQVSKNSQPKIENEIIKKIPKSIDEKIQQKNASIEQILNNWGFKPGGSSYGTREQKKADIEKWLRRFLPGEFEDAFLILERIQYHDSHTVDGYMEGLSRELKQLFDNDLSEILFYPLGESPASSGGNLLYSYRKDLGLPESSFPYVPLKDIDLSGKKAIVFFDDIIGSGNQAVRFAKNHLNNIKIDKYYVALMAFEKGLEKVRNKGSFKKVIVHEIISEELRAFSLESQVFPDLDTRERIKRLCEKYGKLLYPKHPLGYDDSQALIVFPHNTPNNTLPIIWASDKNEKEPGHVWYPVWERIKRT